MWLKVHKRMSFGRAELYFGDDLLGRNYRYWAGGSGLQKSQPVPSLLCRGIKRNKKRLFKLLEDFMDTVYFAITPTHYNFEHCVHEESFIAIIYRR